MFERPLALLALSAVMSLPNPAHAVAFNARGLGQALVYPYYTVNRGQDTLITVVNDGALGALALVIVDEGYNGRAVKFFNLFLAPHDVWTARVSALGETGGAALYSADTSCTWPPIPPGGFPLVSSAYAGGSIFPPDGGPSSITRTREGFIQVVALGAVIPESPLDLGIRHPSPGAAPTCANADSSAGSHLAPPVADTLGGSAAIVNVGEGTFFAYAANALDFTEQVLFSGSANIEANPLRFANSAASAFPTGAVAHVASGDEHFAIDYEQGIDAVSAVFMQESISNDYLVAAGLGANTDWVITFPTKALYTDPFYLDSVRAPFVETFGAPGASNVLADAVQYDQEEGHGATTALTLPWVVNVISFREASHEASGVLGSALAIPVAPFAESGTMTLDLAHGGDETHVITAADGRVLHGLPATGFMVYNIINANAAPGKLANYGGTFPYRSIVSCTTSAVDATPCE
ncbi:MAG: hypothetical protein ACTHK2_05625 [Dokdonella sp.]|uniref:hypothetical protein n=1 Tax=Dokdonella sp. TaxID=2291710 RepID=UPI003F818904